MWEVKFLKINHADMPMRNQYMTALAPSVMLIKKIQLRRKDMYFVYKKCEEDKRIAVII
jgi:hypothetical protein